MDAIEFAKRMSSLKPGLQGKEVLIRTENGSLFPAKIKFIKKDVGCLDLTEENVECIVIGY